MPSPLRQLLDELLATGEVTAAAAIVGTSERVLVQERTAGLPPGGMFDLASLTKPWTATLAMVLESTGELPLARRLGSIFDRVDPRLADRTLEDLLRHRSGLAAWAPLFALVEDIEGAERLILDGQLLGAGGAVYSDLGYLLWSRAARRTLGAELGSELARRVLVPLDVDGIASTARVPPSSVVACELPNDREVVLAAELGVEIERETGPWSGEPQDGNARFLGGVPGHAGLFGTVTAVWKLGAEWLRPASLLSPSVVVAARSSDDRYGLGWWRSRPDGAAGPALTAAAFGMVAFTGGSCWIDPALDLVAVLLVHRRRVAFDLTPWRHRFHHRAVEARQVAG